MATGDKLVNLDSLKTAYDASAKFTAPTEATSTASAAHATGEHFIYNGVLYIATTDIASGATITPNTNCRAVPGGIGGEVSELKSAIKAEGRVIDNISTRSLNIFPVDIKATSVNGVDINYNDGIVTLSGTASASGGRTTPIARPFTLAPGTYTISRTSTSLPLYIQSVSDDSIVGSLGSGTSNTFTLLESAEVYLGVNLTSGVSYSGVTSNVQLQTGSEATSFEKTSYAVGKDTTARTLATTYYGKSVHIMDANGGISDFNSAELNRIYLLIDLTGVSNAPVNKAGTLLTYGRVSDAIVQIYATADDERYVRSKWGATWSGWAYIVRRSDLPSPVEIPLQVLYAFTNITCCGDSLTWSQVYTGESTSRQAYNTYPMCLAKLTGATVEGIASAGYTATQWWDAYNDRIVSKTNQLAIIYLGTNAGFSDTLSTDAPENTDPSTWANTNTGSLAKMIAKFQSVGAKVILVKCYATSATDGNLATTNKVIKDCADRFHCGLSENTWLTDLKYHYYPDLSGSNNVHYNDIGYSAFTSQLADHIANMDADYLKYIIPN